MFPLAFFRRSRCLGTFSAFGILSAAGCSMTSGIDYESVPSVQTDQLEYILPRGEDRSEVTLVATYTNRTDRPAFLARCGRSMPAFQVEKQVGGTWRRVYEPICPMVVGVPVRVEPGATHADTVRITHSRVAGGYPRLEVDQVQGTYRLVYQAHASANGTNLGRLLPWEVRISNPFVLSGAS